MRNFFLSCDWGTSTFRLRLVRVSDHTILEEIISKEGIATIFGNWKAQTGQGTVGREEYVLKVLQNHLQALGKKTTQSLDGIPVLISGMASSSIGIRELPYAGLPFSLDGRDAIIQKIRPDENRAHEVLLISGLSTPADVMRGEETQMMGLNAVYSAGADEIVICIFPGTHSKHVQVLDGKIVDFKTYMTGELFDLISGSSILKEAVSPGVHDITPDDFEAFDQGIVRSVTSNILHSLFSVRVNDLFKLFGKEQNYQYLSGLLIGTELRDLLENDPGRIQLCSGSNLYPLYQRGLEKLNLKAKTSFISPELMDSSAVEGQIKIFQQYYGG
ncbi:MAG: 2-dehydro-3-deoxygalactonokinase [Bacteroidota bacterium]|nr:2-dehydro-3-deoxygalactonokinase [Bacteroidota bacterium]